MKNLGNLKPSAGSNVGPKRLGRGPGSGLGKQSGKGAKGQRARKGGGIPPGFEGGQMPLYRRLPKRGFFSLNRVHYSVVNVSDLAKFDSGTTVNAEALVKAGVITNTNHPVKLLGDGELSKSLTVVVAKASAKAKLLVEKAGGKVQES